MRAPEFWGLEFSVVKQISLCSTVGFGVTEMGNNGDATVEPMKLTSFRSRRKAPAISGETDDFVNLLHGSDPIRIELTRLENELRG